jgi:hypothetical protein
MSIAFSLRGAAATAVLAAASSAVIAAPEEANQAPARPFKASFSTHEVLNFDLACPTFPFLQGTTTGTGNATHLGKTTLTSTDCVTQVSESQFIFTNGKFTLTAANGDTVTANYSGSLSQVSDSPVSNLSGSYQITGGTGRFSGASGSGYLQGTSNLKSGEANYVATGILSY